MLMNWNKCLFLWSVRKLEIVYIAQYIHTSMTPPCTPPLNMVFTIFLWRCWTWTSVFCWRCREKTVYINSLTTLSTSMLFHVHLNMDFDDLSLEYFSWRYFITLNLNVPKESSESSKSSLFQNWLLLVIFDYFWLLLAIFDYFWLFLTSFG